MIEGSKAGGASGTAVAGSSLQEWAADVAGQLFRIAPSALPASGDPVETGRAAIVEEDAHGCKRIPYGPLVQLLPSAATGASTDAAGEISAEDEDAAPGKGEEHLREGIGSSTRKT